MNNNAKIFILVIFILILGVVSTVVLRSGDGSMPPPGKYDVFAQCLKDEGAVFYGAFWCPHCQSQKKLFGSSARLLPYVECSTVDGNAQTKQCIDDGVTSYPTWAFADGSRLTGEIPLEQLSAKTGCVLPLPETPLDN